MERQQSLFLLAKIIFTFSITLLLPTLHAYNILITGGAGFIGSHLATNLLKRGDNVAIIDNFNDECYDPVVKRKSIDVLKNIDVGGKLTIYEDDLADKKTLQKICSEYQPDIICHLAACGSVAASIDKPHLCLERDISVAFNLLEYAKQSKVKRFIFASSSSIYGNNPNIPLKETDAVDNLRSYYAASKRAIELIIGVYHMLYNIPAACFRFFNVYGPNGRRDAAIYKFIHKISNNEPITMYGDGSMTRDFVYIDDIINALIRAIDSFNGFEAINLGSGQEITLKDLVAAVEQVVGKKASINRQPILDADIDRSCSDISKAKQLLGWDPKVFLTDGLKRTYDWYQENCIK